MLSIGKGELDGNRRVHTGDQINCDKCGGNHILTGCRDSDGKPTELLLTYTCGEKTYLAAVDNKLLW